MISNETYLWLPQMITFSTDDTRTLWILDSIAFARFSSRRVIAVMFCSGILGAANLAQIRAFVFAGLPTTRTGGGTKKRSD